MGQVDLNLDEGEGAVVVVELAKYCRLWAQFLETGVSQ